VVPLDGKYDTFKKKMDIFLKGLPEDTPEGFVIKETNRFTIGGKILTDPNTLKEMRNWEGEKWRKRKKKTNDCDEVDSVCTLEDYERRVEEMLEDWERGNKEIMNISDSEYSDSEGEGLNDYDDWNEELFQTKNVFPEFANNCEGLKYG
jgi:hypothetical protein